MMYGFYNGYEGYGAGHMLGFGGGIMMIVFWVLIFALVVWVMHEAKGVHTRHGSQAMNILKERYAKGEISKEEFDEKKKDLSA